MPSKSGSFRSGARLAARERGELLDLLRPCFARPEPWLQAGKYLRALAGGLARRNGWTIAEHAGDRAPDKTQRLLSRAVWDTAAATGVVAASRGRRPPAGGVPLLRVTVAPVRDHVHPERVRRAPG
jgi:hypothetical protein